MEQRKQKKKPEAKPGRAGASPKRTLLILSAAALVLILMAVGLLAWLFSGLSGLSRGAPQPLEDYLADQWPIFRLRAWDAETGALELDYPLRFSYAQMEKYGAKLEELQALPAGNLATAADLKTAAREAAGVVIRAVTVYGLTTDNRIAYTVHPDGSVTACWETGDP